MNRSKTALSTLLALIPLALWGSLYPMIKIGYKTLTIDESSTPDILMFAALRFTVCGGLLCLYSAFTKKTVAAPRVKSVGLIILMGFFAIVLHYALTYVSLATADSSKTALLKQTGVLIYVCFAFLFIKEETFSIWKIVGAIVGFCGIIAMNATTAGITFTVGDVLILLASVCTVVSSILTRLTVKETSPFWVTGISQLFGGVILLAAGLIMGGSFPTFTPEGIASFAYICAASITSYVMWTWLLRTESVSRMFVIKFAEPLFACLFGAVLLGEDILHLQYLMGFLLIACGIVIAEKSKEARA